jgi:hypothetical protein
MEWSEGITIMMEFGEILLSVIAARPTAGAVFLPKGSMMKRIFSAFFPKGCK